MQSEARADADRLRAWRVPFAPHSPVNRCRW